MPNIIQQGTREGLDLLKQQSQGLDLTARTPDLPEPEVLPEDRPSLFGLRSMSVEKNLEIKRQREIQNLEKLSKSFEISDKVIKTAHTKEGEARQEYLKSIEPSIARVFGSELVKTIRTFANDPGGYQDLLKTVKDPQQQAILQTFGKAGDLTGAMKYIVKATTKGKGQTINIGGENALVTALGKKGGEQLVENKDKAVKAAESIKTANESIKILDSGIITGFGAEFITNLGRVVKRMGFDIGTDVENTQAFVANQGRAVLDILGSGALGAGTGISDNDRLFAKNIAGGNIVLDEKAIRRIISLNAKVSKNVIERHNKEFARVKNSPIDLKVELPAFKGRELDPEVRFKQIQEDGPNMTREQILDQMINEGY